MGASSSADTSRSSCLDARPSRTRADGSERVHNSFPTPSCHASAKLPAATSDDQRRESEFEAAFATAFDGWAAEAFAAQRAAPHRPPELGTAALVEILVERQLAYRGPLVTHLISWVLFEHGTLAVLHWLPRRPVPPACPHVRHDARRPACAQKLRDLACRRLQEDARSQDARWDETQFGRLACFERTQLAERDDYDDRVQLETFVVWFDRMGRENSEDAARARLAADLREPRAVHTWHPVLHPGILAALLPLFGDVAPLAKLVYDYADPPAFELDARLMTAEQRAMPVAEQHALGLLAGPLD